MPVTTKCSKCGNQFMTPDGAAAQSMCAICRRSASPPPKPAEQIKAEPPEPPAMPAAAPASGSKAVEWVKQNRAATAAMAVVAVSLLLVGCIGSVSLVGIKLFRGASNSIQALATMQAADDQKTILAWLQKNLHDPESLEIVEWGPRKEYVLATNPSHEKFGVTIVTVRIRSKNGFGARVVGDYRFEVKGGKVIEGKAVD